MDRKTLKRESREFAFSNKLLIWKPLLTLFLISFIVNFVSIFGFGVNDFVGEFISFAASLFISMITPIFTVGIYLMIKSRLKGETVSFSDSIKDIKPKWSNFFTTYIMTSVYVSLWSLLFIIPGIIKTYSYSQALYIQADNPDMHWKECIRKSREMMDGHKWELFMLHFSLIGWVFLFVVTCSIAMIWFVPYLATISAKYHMYLTNQKDGIKVEAYEVRYCIFCGNRLTPNARFCSKCGSAVK